MDKKGIADIFSAISKIYDSFLSAITFGGIHKWQKFLIAMTDKGNSLLDIGTGTGEVAKKAISMGYTKVVGIDISFDMLKVAKSKCAKCHFIVADAEYLPFKDNSFDIITLSLVYRHLLDKEKFLKEALRVLKGKGSLRILDIGRIPITGALVFFMKTLFKLPGLLIFGREKWEFFIHSIENSLNIEEIKIEMERYGIIFERADKKLGGLVILIFGRKGEE